MIERIADIPFRGREPLELLALTEERGDVDIDYVGFGHCRVGEVWLESAGSRQPLRDVLILALHSADGADPRPDDVELEFVMHEGLSPYSVSARLSSFLAVHLPALRGDARAVVLAMCNPHRAVLPAPVAIGSVPMYYATGDVESWLDPEGRLCLRADAWNAARGG